MVIFSGYEISHTRLFFFFLTEYGAASTATNLLLKAGSSDYFLKTAA